MSIIFQSISEEKKKNICGKMFTMKKRSKVSDEQKEQEKT